MNRLKELREERGMNMREAAAACGYKYMTYVNYEKEERQLYSEQLIKIADFYGVTIDYLLCRDAKIVQFKPPLVQKYEKLDDTAKAVIDSVMDIELKRVPAPDLGTIRHYLFSPAAGVNGLSEDDYEDIPRTPNMPKEADFCLTVSGDSMEPYINGGEIVYISEKAPLKELEVGVWSVDGSTYVKQYAPGYSGELYLLSANPLRQDANITIWPDGNQSVQYFGKVLLDKKLPRPIYK